MVSLYQFCPAEWMKSRLTLIDSGDFCGKHVLGFPFTYPAVIAVNDADDLPHLIELLRGSYPADFVVSVKQAALNTLQPCPVAELRADMGVEGLFIPPKDQFSSMEAFHEIVAHLRAPDGCPWDREQTHESLRPYLLEEAYETLDALDGGDLQELKAELGDVLLQIFLHGQIGSETGVFDVNDVAAAAGRKMVRRHPHVFGTVEVNGDVDQVLRNWQDIKEAERQENGTAAQKGILDGVSKNMSALLLAQAYQGRAAAVGFDWSDLEGVLTKVEEEVDELRSADTKEEQASEFGDLMFVLVNVARWLHLDAETEVRKAAAKFYQRFAYVEQCARQDGRLLTDMTLAEMDVYWDQAKVLGL